jgi:hypothetical protein
MARSAQGAASAHTSVPIYGWFTEGFGTRDLQKRRRFSASWRHSGAKPNDDCAFLWRYSQEIGRLGNVGRNLVYEEALLCSCV